MALPTDSGTAWPPQSFRQAYEDMAMMDAWYAGDIEALETLYSTTRLVRQSGIWGQAKRFFMGTPNPGNQSQRPVKLHVPVPAEISRISSQILYGEMPKVQFEDLDDDGDAPKIPDGSRKTMNNRLGDLLDDSTHAALLEAGELGSAHGGSFLRVCWDVSIVPDGPFVTAVSQDAAVPSFRFGRLVSVVFWAELPTPDNTPGAFRLLEEHTQGRIEYGLYHTMDKYQIGVRVPLTEHPATAGLASMVDADSSVETGTDLLTAVYIPNVKPTRLRRKDPVQSQLGRSDYEGVDGLFDAMNETYTSWMRDVRIARSRIFASKDALDVGAPGQGAQLDLEREVFMFTKGNLYGGLGTSGGDANPNAQIMAQQFTIRWQEHQETANEILGQIFTAAGYSPATFGLIQHAAKSLTATEVQSREKLTMLTRGAKILYAKPQLQHLIAALLDVDQNVFGGPGRAGTLPEVAFPDAAAPSIDALAQTLQLLRAAEAASTETLVQMLNPDWEPNQVAAEVERINKETPALSMPALPDPTGMSGHDLNGNGNADGTNADQRPAAGNSGGGGNGGDAGGRGGAAGSARP